MMNPCTSTEQIIDDRKKAQEAVVKKNDNQKRVAIYARSATNEGGIEKQCTLCKGYAHTHMEGIAEYHYFVEIRPGFEYPPTSSTFRLMMYAARRGEFSTLLLTSLDRISRDFSTVYEFLEELRGYGVEVISMENGNKVLKQVAIYIRVATTEQAN